jgi:hypothetical protein
VLNLCSSRVGWFTQVVFNLDGPESSVQVDLHMATAQRESEIWRRFGGGSDRNRALLDNKGNSMHGMQIVQSRINTAYFVSC